MQYAELYSAFSDIEVECLK